MNEQASGPLAPMRSLQAEIDRRVALARAFFQRRAAYSAAWAGPQRHSIRGIAALVLLAVLVLRAPHASLAAVVFYLLCLVALFLPLFAGPRRYALALALCALVGAVVASPANDLLILYFVLLGMAGSQLPVLLALPVVIVVGALFALGELHAGSTGSLVPMLSWFAATFAGTAATHIRRIAAARQALMLVALERSNAELRLAHEQLRLDSERAAELAAAEERERIAREIHDVLAHTLTVLVVQVGAVKRLITRDPERARQQLDLVAQLTRDGLAEVRRSIHELRSPDEEGVAAIAALVAAFADRTGTACTFAEAADLPALPPALSKALYRVTQEALTNAIRHGNAHVIDVRLAASAAALILTIEDDGVGSAAAPPVVGGGNGLRGALERLQAFGGSLVAEPRPEGGYRMLATVPLAALTSDAGRAAPGNDLAAVPMSPETNPADLPLSPPRPTAPTVSQTYSDTVIRNP